MGTHDRFNWRHTEPEPGTAVFELEGRLQAQPECYQFQDAVLDSILDGVTRVVLGLGGIERVNSNGVGILASIYVAVQQSDGQLVLAATPRPIGALLDIFWFLKLVPHVASVKEALATLETESAASSAG